MRWWSPFSITVFAIVLNGFGSSCGGEEFSSAPRPYSGSGGQDAAADQSVGGTSGKPSDSGSETTSTETGPAGAAGNAGAGGMAGASGSSGTGGIADAGQEGKGEGGQGLGGTGGGSSAPVCAPSTSFSTEPPHPKALEKFTLTLNTNQWDLPCMLSWYACGDGEHHLLDPKPVCVTGSNAGCTGSWTLQCGIGKFEVRVASHVNDPTDCHCTAGCSSSQCNPCITGLSNDGVVVASCSFEIE